MKFGKIAIFFSLIIMLVAFLYRDYNVNYAMFSNSDKVYYQNELKIGLSDNKITLNGRTIRNNNGSVYTSNDVEYYENRDFYDSGRDYGKGNDADKHTAEEAAEVTVVNITHPGNYRISGNLSNGQIRVDLGKNADENETAVVNLILDGVDINCSIAPAIIFKNVYECGNDDIEQASINVDTSAAGANITIADGSINNLTGSHVAKILKDSDEGKKLCKQDGTIFSEVSLNINGEPNNTGVLNVNADFEGISSNLHITINGGNINIVSLDDGINTNEKDVSVTTINGGNIRILAGLKEDGGDGIDSNGYIVSNGGTTVSIGHHRTDSGIDNDAGYFANGGTLISYGSYVDWAEVGSTQEVFNLQFENNLSDQDFILITDEDGNAVFCYDPSLDEMLLPYSFQRFGFVITSPNFELGKNYNLYVGYNKNEADTVDGTHYNGMYDVSTITSFNAVQQKWYANDDYDHGGFGREKGKSYDIASTNFVMDRIVSCYALIYDAE